MYLKNKTEVCKIRITPQQQEFINCIAKDFGLTRSEVVRMIIDSYRAREVLYENK